MKKQFALFLVLALAFTLSVFAGGGGQQSTTTGGAAKTTLKIVGCGPFSTTGPDGTINAITGLEVPGYKMIVDAWNKQYPNVSLVIEAYPWDNWQASIQTAVLAGGVDIIMHGATLTDLSMPLNDLVAADPQYASKRLSYATRRAETLGPLDKVYITGIPVAIAPMLAILNKDILSHYGINPPATSWTWEDLAQIAQKCTGKDPVTGQQTYGIQFHNSHSNNEIWKNFTTMGYGIGANPTVQYGTTAKNTKVVYDDENAMKIWQFIERLAAYTSPADREGIAVSDPAADLNIAIYFTEDAVISHDNLKAAGLLDKYVPQNLPVIASGSLRGSVTPYLGDFNLAICKTSTQKDLAWEFIKFSTTNEAALQYYTSAGRPVNNSDYYPNLGKFIAKDWVDAIGRAIAKIPDTYSPASGMYSNNISFGNLNATIGGGMRSLLMKTGTAKDAATSVQKMVNEYIASIK
jgi:ABC-type glycerol-3-phosphate transport system substrate-binding protein